MVTSDKIAILATIIATLSMVSTIWQVVTTRKHNKLSVRPHIDFTVNKFFDRPVSIAIANDGLGPGIINSFSIILDGQEYLVTDGTIPPLVLEELNKTVLKSSLNIFSSNTPVAVGKELKFISFDNSCNNAALHNEAIIFIDRLGFTINYRSMYGEKFKVSRIENRAEH
ncbi:hypothetical protein OL229_12530 [Neisseriaceae bacterium JH1-16]|nr:hypothetical protein [Neisseriaceae bacterium JH1-16]